MLSRFDQDARASKKELFMADEGELPVKPGSAVLREPLTASPADPVRPAEGRAGPVPQAESGLADAPML